MSPNGRSTQEPSSSPYAEPDTSVQADLPSNIFKVKSPLCSGVAPLILSLCTVWRSLICLTLGPLYPWENSPRYSLNVRLGGPLNIWMLWRKAFLFTTETTCRHTSLPLTYSGCLCYRPRVCWGGQWIDKRKVIRVRKGKKLNIERWRLLHVQALFMKHHSTTGHTGQIVIHIHPQHRYCLSNFWGNTTPYDGNELLKHVGIKFWTYQYIILLLRRIFCLLKKDTTKCSVQMSRCSDFAGISI
jgi:hypothetical protein